MAEVTIEIPQSREGTHGDGAGRVRRYKTPYSPAFAVAFARAAGDIQNLGDVYPFDDGVLYVNGYSVEATESPTWSVITVYYVRYGELRYLKVPTEVGYRSVSTTIASSRVDIPYIQKQDIGQPYFEWVTQNIEVTRRETVAVVTRNIESVQFNSAFLDSINDNIGQLIGSTGVGEDDWLFDSFQSVELSDKVTQVVGSFRATSELPARPVPSAAPREFDIPIPALPAFGKYVVVNGPQTDYGGTLGFHAGPPTIIATRPYALASVGPAVGQFLPILPS